MYVLQLMVHSSMFVFSPANIWKIHTATHAHTDTNNKVHCYTLVSHSPDWFNFPFYYYFPWTLNQFGTHDSWPCSSLKECWSPQKRWTSVLFWLRCGRIVFLPNNSCVEEVTRDNKTRQKAGRKQLKESHRKTINDYIFY